jgi:hypothetical protein
LRGGAFPPELARAGGIGGEKLGAAGGAAVVTFICQGIGTAIGEVVGGIGGGIEGAVGGEIGSTLIEVKTSKINRCWVTLILNNLY